MGRGFGEKLLFLSIFDKLSLVKDTDTARFVSTLKRLMQHLPKANFSLKCRRDGYLCRIRYCILRREFCLEHIGRTYFVRESVKAAGMKLFLPTYLRSLNFIA